MIRLVSIFICITLLIACRPTRIARDPSHTFKLSAIQEDYSIFRNTLEKYHPSLYWYTTKDSMDYFFNWGQQQLKDSMTEMDFYKVLSYVIAKVHCGHSTIKNSKYYTYYLDTAKHRALFPLSVKVWKDTVVSYGSLNRSDSVLYGGAIIKSINGIATKSIVDSLVKFVSTDGYNENHLYQWLSNRGNFASLYTAVYGLAPTYQIEFLNKNNEQKSVTIKNYVAAADTNRKKVGAAPVRLSKKQIHQQKLNDIRSMQIDTAGSTAVMRLNSFGNNYHLRSYFKKAFAAIKKNNITNLVIDVRTNGGGNVTNAIRLGRYMSSHSLKVADSIYAIRRCISANSHIEKRFQHQVSILLATRKKLVEHNNGEKKKEFHFNYFEKHQFKPLHKDFFSGNVYIITGANSFSATSIFVNFIAAEKNIWTVGEETGGGSYGNSGFMIPDVTLPNTKLKFRLPLFRMVANKENPKTGRGIYPEIPAVPTVSTIRNGKDIKMETVLELIRKNK